MISPRRTALDQSLKKIWPTADAQQVKKMGDLLMPGFVVLVDFPHGKTIIWGFPWPWGGWLRENPIYTILYIDDLGGAPF